MLACLMGFLFFFCKPGTSFIAKKRRNNETFEDEKKHTHPLHTFVMSKYFIIIYRWWGKKQERNGWSKDGYVQEKHMPFLLQDISI